MNIRNLMYPDNGDALLEPIVLALSGGPTEPMELHEPVYVVAVLQHYWLSVYCLPGPPSHDELHQSSFADWIELLSGRYWRQFNFSKVQMLGYYCSEVENAVPDDWTDTEAKWEQCARAGDWWLEAQTSTNGCLYRLCMYAEGGFDLQFWFFCCW